MIVVLLDGTDRYEVEIPDELVDEFLPGQFSLGPFSIAKEDT